MNRSLAVDARLSQEKVRAVYNKMSRFYDVWGRLAEEAARTRAIELVEIQDGESILDVAVGTGLILAAALRQNPHGWNAGIDISEGMLAKARAKVHGMSGRVELKQGSAFEIPYPDATFDLLLNGYMFDLMPFESMPKILAEFRRVLKPGGRLALVNMTQGNSPWSRVYQWIYQQVPALMGGCRGVLLAQPLEEAGFRVLGREYHEQFFFPSEVILAHRA